MSIAALFSLLLHSEVALVDYFCTGEMGHALMHLSTHHKDQRLSEPEPIGSTARQGDRPISIYRALTSKQQQREIISPE